MKPSLFITSSSESVDVAYALQQNLDHIAQVTVWSQAIFELSHSRLESLLVALDSADFGLFVFAANDVLSVREQYNQAIRDNIIFELGLFIGRLGRERNFIVIPKGNEESLRLPTDLLGLTTAFYEPNRQDTNRHAALGPASAKIMMAVAKHGMREHAVTESSPQPTELNEVVDYSVADKKAILESWMASRSNRQNTSVIRFDEVDRELRLTPGSTKSLIKDVATRWHYVLQHEGEQTILFHQDRLPLLRSNTWVGN